MPPTIAVSFNPGSSHLNAILQYLFAFTVLTPGVSRQVRKNEGGVIQLPAMAAIQNVQKFNSHHLTALKMGFQMMYNLCVNVQEFNVSLSSVLRYAKKGLIKHAKIITGVQS